MENFNIRDNPILHIRDIPIKQIKAEMFTLLADGKTRYIDEIAEELAVGIQDALEAFKQLQRENKLFIDYDHGDK